MNTERHDSLEVFERVASGELTPAEAADIVIARDRPLMQKPAWMPNWIYVPVLLLTVAITAPFQQHSRV